jgi:hypothetical protein
MPDKSGRMSTIERVAGTFAVVNEFVNVRVVRPGLRNRRGGYMRAGDREEEHERSHADAGADAATGAEAR